MCLLNSHLPLRSDRPNRRRSGPITSRRRPGITLVEVLIAATILAMMAAALGTLAATLETTNEVAQSRATTVQHARIALRRIERTARQAATNDLFPGLLSVPDTVGGWTFPERLVVWRPATPPQPGQAPRFSELVVYCPDPLKPQVLLEVTFPGDSQTVPAVDDLVAWRQQLGTRIAASTDRVALTNLLRVATAPDGSRAAARFDITHRPSEQQLQDFRDGNLSWEAVPWVQDLRGTESGIRQTWCRIELQLDTPAHEAVETVPFIGSAAIYYPVTP